MINTPPTQPPLLTRPAIDRQAPARVLTATEIGRLGEAQAQRPANFTRFRHQLLRDAPPPIKSASELVDDPRVSHRAIGEIVHKALQWQIGGDLDQKLRAYAWEEGISDPDELAAAISDVKLLLERTQSSSIMQKLRAARQVYRELPFTLRLGERTVNGKIDVLFRDQFGHWTVLDYKTDAVDGDYAHGHARRYHMQIGLYAAAVEELTGQAPETYLHYIRPAVTVHVAESTWRAAVASIETTLLAALSDSEL